MLAWMLEAGADATQPTRTPSKEAPLHIACAKRNVRALELLLDSLTRSRTSKKLYDRRTPSAASRPYTSAGAAGRSGPSRSLDCWRAPAS